MTVDMKGSIAGSQRVLVGTETGERWEHFSVMNFCTNDAL